MLEPSEPAPMLRLGPLGEELADGVGLTGGVGLVEVDGRGLDGDGDGDCGVQLPFDTCKPLLAPAVSATMFGTQLAPSRVYE